VQDFLTGVGLVLVIEGLLYAALPGMARRMAAEVTNIPETTLRGVGVVVLCAGVGIVWLVRG